MAVEPCEDHSLIVSFADESQRVFDFVPYLEKPMYRHLQVLPEFMKAHVSHRTVNWGNDVDISSERLYRDSR